MGAARGFTLTRPDARYGDTTQGLTANTIAIGKFTLSGAGNQTLTELGLYGYSAGGVTLKLAVFTDDAVNGCPDVIVANSELELAFTAATTAIRTVAYGATKPVLTAGDYWIGAIADGSWSVSLFATGGTALYKASVTYPTWPTASAWETNTPVTWDTSFYAVYETASGAASQATMHSVYRFGPLGCLQM